MEAFVAAGAFVAGFIVAYLTLKRRYDKRKYVEWQFVKVCQDQDIKVHAVATPDGKITMVADFSDNQDLNNKEEL